MDGEGKRSKGGFFHLFDWKGKSPKKLFSNESGLLANEGKENAQNSVKSQFYKGDDKREKSSNKGSSEFSCSSSANSDEGGYGVRAPGLVARLMGLDSLPTSNAMDPFSSPFSDSSSLRAPQYGRSTPRLLSEYNPINYLRIPNKQDMYYSNNADSRPHKVHSLPIERFQTEILPPKSAKPIQISHNKLLSPIRNPEFSPRKDVAYIIEATAKIIEASPKATSNGKVPSIGSSSVPLRIRNLKQKMEAANTSSRPQKSNQHPTAKTMKGQQSDKNQGALESMSSREAFMSPQKGPSNSSRNKGNLPSVAVQAKANNMQRRESSSMSDSFMKQKEKNDAKSNQLPKNHPGREKTIQKRTESRTSNVLRQNNQKQNSVANKESSVSKNLVSNQQRRKAHSMSGSVGPSRAVNKVVIKAESFSSTMGSEVKIYDKEKAIVGLQKKRPVNGVLQIDGTVSDRPSFDKVNGPMKCNVERDECMNRVMVDTKHGVDVVSFTFTSPMTKAMPGVQSPGQTMGKSNSSGIDSCDSGDLFHSKQSMSSFPGLNVIGGDALGALLEQKLRELTNKVKLANCNIIREETCSSASISQNSFPTLNSVSMEHAAQDTKFQFVLDKDKSDHSDDSDWLSVEDQQKWQIGVQSDDMDELNSCSNYSESGKELEHLDPSPVSILELPLVTESCTNITGSKYPLPAGVLEAYNPKSINGSLAAELETELSDSPSIATVDMGREHVTRALAKTQLKEYNSWELEYVKEILNNAELMLEDFTLCQTPNLFDWMKIQENEMEGNEEETSKLGRKVLFDCVGEHLDFIWGQVFFGSWKAWAKFHVLFKMKGWLAEQLYREILGWKSMGDLMVDELLDKDMSTQYGRWLDFDVEAFEEGVEIEKGILTSLVDELVFDLLS
uniref:DUF4378 domain-containing protein n=1 Tax=Rhizophora mucronata TaxID=61149 RepID=A0A2P2K069_RHIMU